MTTRNASGSAGHHPDAPATSSTRTTTKQHDPHQRSRSAAVLVAYALLLLGMPGARFDQLIVQRCPVEGCRYAHRHLVPAGTWKQPLIRPPRCRPWLRYRIEVTSVVPAVQVAGRLRRAAS